MVADEPLEPPEEGVDGPAANERGAVAEQQLAALREELERTRASRDALIQQALGLRSAAAAGAAARGDGRRGMRLVAMALVCVAMLVGVALLAQQLKRLSAGARPVPGQDATTPRSAPPAARQTGRGAASRTRRIEIIPVPRLSWVGRAALSPDGEVAAVAGADGRALLVRLDDGAVLAELGGHRGMVRSLAFSPDGSRVATGGADGVVRLHARDGRPAITLRLAGAPVRDLAFGRRFLAVAADAEALELYTLAGGPVRRLTGHTGWVRAVALSADERRLASGGEDEELRVWDPLAGRLEDHFPGQGQWINALAFSPDGRRLAVAGFDKRVRLWDLQAKQIVHRLWGHVQRVASLGFDARGRLLATAGLDRKIVVWDVRTGEHRHLLAGHERQVNSVVFGPTGHFLLSSSGDGTLRRWPLPPPSSQSVAPLPPPGPGELTLRGNTSGQRARVRVVDERGEVLEEGRRQLAEILRSGPDDQTLRPDPELVKLLYEIASHFGRQREILVISGYRSPRFNRLRTRQSTQVGEKSQHMLGKAIDLRIEGVAITTLQRYVRELRRGGVGFYADSNFLHIDTGPVRYWSGD